MDIPNDPLYKFGYGLSYSKFEYSNLSYKEYEDYFLFNVDVLNNSNHLGTEIVMLFVNVLNATISLPMAELKGFNRLEIKPNEKINVEIKLEKKDLTYFIENELVNVKGEVEVFVGGSLDNNLKTTITL
jgi:beta-glucosidase